MKKTLIITSLTIPTALGVFGYYYYNGFQAGKGNVQKDLKFHVNVDYCLGCGFRQSAELFSKKVIEKYPKAQFTLKPNEDEPGSLEIFVKLESGKEKQIHSALKGDGRIYRENVQKIIEKLDDFVLNK